MNQDESCVSNNSWKDMRQEKQLRREVRNKVYSVTLPLPIGPHRSRSLSVRVLVAPVVTVPLQGIGATEVFPAVRALVRDRLWRVVGLEVPLPVMGPREGLVTAIAGVSLDAGRGRWRYRDGGHSRVATRRMGSRSVEGIVRVVAVL